MIRSMQKRIVLFTLFLGILAVMGGLLPVSANAAEQVIRYNLANEPKTLDPTINGDLMAGFIIDHCFEGLLRDRNGKLQPGMAES